MSDPELNELKRRLRAAGFEVYRTRDERVSLAERVRDNLILDSGIAVGLDERSRGGPWDEARLFRVGITLRAQASHFPGATSETVAQEAETLTAAFLGDGYERSSSRTSSLPDPGNPERSLDTSHEVLVERTVSGLSALFEVLRAAFSRPRASSDD